MPPVKISQSSTNLGVFKTSSTHTFIRISKIDLSVYHFELKRLEIKVTKSLVYFSAQVTLTVNQTGRTRTVPSQSLLTQR